MKSSRESQTDANFTTTELAAECATHGPNNKNGQTEGSPNKTERNEQHSSLNFKAMQKRTYVNFFPLAHIAH